MKKKFIIEIAPEILSALCIKNQSDIIAYAIDDTIILKSRRLNRNLIRGIYGKEKK